QAKYGYKVSLSELKPGDLLFFKTYKRDVSHVGIYIGDGKMVHAATRGGRVMVSSIHEPYYRQRFLFAKRVVEAKGEEIGEYGVEGRGKNDGRACNVFFEK
ncbi:MAG: C40 family peptidase, partial [Candidatus Caldipriscus sp.]